MKIIDEELKPSCAYQKIDTFHGEKDAKEVHCMYSGMAKGTSRAKTTLNSKNIKPVALAIVELHESEDIRQAGSQLVSLLVS